jgi:hypothetical protein
MDFFNTVRGIQFVDGTIPQLIDSINQLTESLNKKKTQYVKVYNSSYNLEEKLNEELKKGSKIVQILPLVDNKNSINDKIIAVFEEEKNRE